VIWLANEAKQIMAAQVSIPLTSISDHFCAATQELPGGQIGSLLRQVGFLVDKHFLLCADIADTLKKDGWQLRCQSNNVICQHPDIKTPEQALFRIKAIGLDPKNVIVSSTWDNWFPPINGSDIMEALGFEAT